MSIRRLIWTALALAGCGRGEAPAGQAVADSGGGAGSGRVISADSSFDVALPSRWAGHYVVDSLSTAERGRALPGALVFSYLPVDTTIARQALAVVAVYDSASWAAVAAEGGPPPGDSVASKGGRIYVLGLPQSNPFPDNSADAVMFTLLELRPTERAALVHPR